jgi:hypothetical protein
MLMKVGPATKKMLLYSVGGIAILFAALHIHHLHEVHHHRWVAQQKALASARKHAWKKRHPATSKHHDGFMKTKHEFEPSWATGVATAEAEANSLYHEMAVQVGRTAM